MLRPWLFDFGKERGPKQSFANARLNPYDWDRAALAAGVSSCRSQEPRSTPTPITRTQRTTVGLPSHTGACTNGDHTGTYTNGDHTGTYGICHRPRDQPDPSEHQHVV